MKKHLVFTISLTALVLCSCSEQQAAHKGAVATEASARSVTSHDESTADTARGRSGQHQATPDWIPAEHKNGNKRWRDAGVYVDGKPIGFLWHSELPRALKPVWIDSIEMLEFKPGDTGPRERIVREKRFRITDYLVAAGVDLDKIKSLHVYGRKEFAAIIDGDELRRVKDTLYFRFGRVDSGKPILGLPRDVKTNTSFDRIKSIAVYIDKTPPSLGKNQFLELDGKRTYGIPYLGKAKDMGDWLRFPDPIRGGIRIYKNDRLALWVKRHSMPTDDNKVVKVDENGTLTWNLLSYLRANKIPTKDIIGAHLTFRDRPVGYIGRDKLASAAFKAAAQGRGKMMLDGQAVNALMLVSKKRPVQTAAR